MKREELKALGLSEEVIEKVVALHGNVTEELKTEKANSSTLTRQLEEANKTISELNNKINSTEGIDDLKNQIATQKSNYEKMIEDIKYEHELTNYLANIKFTSDLVKEAVTSKFKEKQFKLENGKLLGADDFIAELKKSQPTAFVVENEDGQAGVKVSGIGDNNNPGAAPTLKTMF